MRGGPCYNGEQERVPGRGSVCPGTGLPRPFMKGAFMKRFKNLVIGGIQSKIFNLILITVLLLTAAYMAISFHQNNVLTTLAGESSRRQQETLGETTDTIMGSVVEQSMSRSTELEAALADQMFNGLKTRVQMLGEYAEKLFSDPDAYPRMAFEAPDPSRNGEVLTQLILAEGTDLSDPDLYSRLGLAANMSDLMISLFGVSAETNSCFIALPDGAFLVTDDRTGAKFDPSGDPTPYDPRTRPWYIQAVEAGGLIFTDVEVDAFTGDIGIVCAMPVYADGSLAAVVGSDLFLTSMREAVQASDDDGTFLCVINQNGHVVFSPRSEGVFAVLPSGEAQDLRLCENKELAAVVSDAMQDVTDMKVVALEDGDYYIIGAPMETVGWTLISVCSLEVAGQSGVLLRDNYQRIEEETSAEYLAQTGRVRNSARILLIGLTLLMLAGALILGKRIVTPLNTITRRISRVDEDNPVFRMEDAYRTGDEIEELARSFADISQKTMDYMAEVKAVTAEKERVSTELSLATRIQATMMPHIFPAFPDRPEFDIFASMDPAKEVGGDFYDYFLIDEDHLCMVAADVSGKGVPGALFMMASKIILQSCAMLGHSAADILSKTNDAICSNNEAQMFVTVWLGILELSTGILKAANAGHEYPVLKRPGEGFEVYRDRHGFVLGGMEGMKYREYELLLEPGAKLFIYTDGLPEATNAGEEMFGIGRVVEALNEEDGATPEKTIKNVRRAVNDFVKDAEQFDDLTMLCIEYKGIKRQGGEKK